MKHPRCGSLADEIRQFLDAPTSVPRELRGAAEQGRPSAGAGPAAPLARAHLVTVRPGSLTAIEIPDGEVTIGRSADCGLVLDSVDVSRQHCRLVPLPNGSHEVEDLCSAGGVVVNGMRVDACELAPFDRLGIGDYELLYLGRQIRPDEVTRLLSPHYRTGAPSLGPPEQLRASLRARLTWLAIMFQELRSEEEMAPLLDALLDELFRAPACVRRAMVVLVDPPPATGLRAVKLRNAPPDHVRRRALAQYLPLVRRALLEDAVVEGDTPLGPSTVCVPMRSHQRRSAGERRRFQPGSAEGAFLLEPAEGGLGPEERRRLQVLARQVAVLLSGAELQRRATIDALTGLTNRAHAEQILRHEEARSIRTGEPLSVLLLDLDAFKAINDTRGHAAGDDVLRAVAEQLRRELRLSDCAARWGGEEFLVVLPGTDRAGAAKVADKLLTTIRRGPTGLGTGVTVSIGVACCPGDADEAAALVECADIALYHAKEAGKDRRVVFDAPLARASLERTRRVSIRSRRPAEGGALGASFADTGPVQGAGQEVDHDAE